MDTMHERAYDVDFARLERGLALQTERVGEGRYHVWGGSGSHWVSLTPGHPQCDCGDHIWRDSVCKHILAALLRDGDEHVIAALGGLVKAIREGELSHRNSPAVARAAPATHGEQGLAG